MFETLPDPDAFWRQSVLHFKQHRASKEPLPEQESLGHIRKRRRLAQVTIATRLATTQSEISKLESRSDLRVSALTAYIVALGGTLDLVARFPGLHIRIKLGDP